MMDFQKIRKYRLKEEDWDDMNIVNSKMAAESVVASFIVIRNALAELISPKESELIDNTESELLAYLDKYFIKNTEQENQED
jgi:hypothetical protein